MAEKVPYYRVKRRKAYLELPKDNWMRKLGYKTTPLGPPGDAAKAKCREIVEQAKAIRDQGKPKVSDHFEDGTLGAFYDEWRSKSLKYIHSSLPVRHEWRAAWHHIGPHLGNVMLAKLDVDRCEQFYTLMNENQGPVTRHRAVAKLSELLKQAVARERMRSNPMDAISNPAPKGRTEVWGPFEVDALIDTAFELKMYGMEIAICLMRECGLAPVDVRTLKRGHLATDGKGYWIERKRTKTGAGGVWALTEETWRRISTYLESHTQDTVLLASDGLPYTAAYQWSRDFARIRRKAFGNKEKRLSIDIRRTFSVELQIGGASDDERASMLANTINKNGTLEKTYTPPSVENARRLAEIRGSGQQVRKEHAQAQASQSDGR